MKLVVWILVVLLARGTNVAAQTTRLVSVATGGAQGDYGSGWSGLLCISADGRYVAFGSYASNLVPGDTNGVADVFLHDRQSGVTSRVSVATGGAQGDSHSDFPGWPSISADGRYVAFHSEASNLVSGDTNDRGDVFVHDRQSGVTSRVSIATGGGQGNSDSTWTSISAADGRYVAFRSLASNLVPEDTNGTWDVFVHDRQSGVTSRVSVATGGAQGNGVASLPSISGDGRYVAFNSYASNLVPGDTNGVADVFLHDRQSGVTSQVSVATGGGQGNSDSGSPSISADGRYVAFHSEASNLVSGDTNDRGDVFVHDRQSGVTSRVSIATGGGQGNSDSGSPAISADGRFVAFMSWASNLVPGDTNGSVDVFVHDRQSGVTIRVSVATGGGQGDFYSGWPSISADGRYVAFHSEASNLVSGDTNDRGDVFVHDRHVSLSQSWNVSNVVATIGPAGQGAVSIRYDLTGSPNGQATIRLVVSRDGGLTFPIEAAIVSGAVGPGQTAGSNRQIVWNAAADLPAESGSNYVTRVVADDGAWGDSNTFSLDLSPTGDLTGTVRDSITGAVLSGTLVSLSGIGSVVTAGNGSYAFAAIPAGPRTLTVSRSGYHSSTQQVTIQGSATRIADVALGTVTGTTPRIVRGYCRTSRPEHPALYLDGVSLPEEFAVEVDWAGHAPGFVRWILPNGSMPTDLCPGSSVSRELNVGFGFGPGGTLEAELVTGDPHPITSGRYRFDFEVIPNLPGILPSLLVATVTGNVVGYHLPSISSGAGLPFGQAAGLEVPEWVPLFGGQEHRLAGPFDVSVDVDDQGVASARVGVVPASAPSTRIAGVEFSPGISGTARWWYRPATRDWTFGGAVQADLRGEADVPLHPIVFFLPPPLPPLPAYWRGHVEVEGRFGAELIGWEGNAVPTMQGVADLDPLLYAEAVLGVGVADLLAAEGYLGGGVRSTLRWPAEEPLEELQLYLAGGVRVVITPFEFELPLLEYAWDPFAPQPLALPSGHAATRLIPRRYLRSRTAYARFSANDPSQPLTLGSRTIEIPIQQNVFEASTPDIACSGEDRMLVWIWDDPLRSPMNRAELVWSSFRANMGTWSDPAPVADDGTADARPRLAALPGGDFMVVWEDAKLVLGEPADPNDPLQVLAKLEELKAATEVSVARYRRSTGRWSGVIRLSDDDVFDGRPRIASQGERTAVAWIRNAAGDLVGSDQAPNEILLSRNDGGMAWLVPSVAATHGSIIKSDLAFNGADPLLVLSSDMDRDLGTVADRELFGLLGWSGSLTRLTNDSSEDENPQAAFGPVGASRIAWYSGGDVVMASTLGLMDLQVVVPGSGSASSGRSDFRLSVGGDGRLGIVWPEARADGAGADVLYAHQDPSGSRWTRARQLTYGPELEYGYAVAHDALGRLFVAYDRAQIQHESRTVDVGGEPVTIDNVPVKGQVDLYLLQHSSVRDLAISAADLEVSPANPFPGLSATVTATVHNRGDVEVADVRVVFNANGVTIGTAIVAGPIAGGESAETSSQWAVPASGGPYTVEVIVDATGDASPADNSATFSGLVKPDAVVSRLVDERFASGLRSFLLRVTNAGTVDLPSVDVVLRLDGGQGLTLGTVTVPGPVAPGTFREATFEWQAPAIVPVDAVVRAIVDPQQLVDEFDETNNERRAVLWMNRQPAGK